MYYSQQSQQSTGRNPVFIHSILIFYMAKGLLNVSF